MRIQNVILSSDDKYGSAVINTLTASNVASGSRIRATHGKTSGKWYWEVTHLAPANEYRYTIGITGIYNLPFTTYFDIVGTGVTAKNTRGIWGSDGNKYPENVAYGTKIAVGFVTGVALDMDNGTLAFYRNGVSMGISHTNIKELGDVFPFFGCDGTSGPKDAMTFRVNFGTTAFSYPVPNEFKAYNVYIYDKFLISTGDMKVASIGNEPFSKRMVKSVSASSSHNSSYLPSNVFDENTTTSWITLGGATTGWVAVQLKSKQYIKSYKVTSRHDLVTTAPSEWTFEGSADSVNWTLLDTQTSVTWILGESKEFSITNSSEFEFFRINVTKTFGNVSLGIAELFLETACTLLIGSKEGEKSFIDIGMERNQKINLREQMSRVKYINNDTENVGSGKIFKQSIDTSKISIKKVSIT